MSRSLRIALCGIPVAALAGVCIAVASQLGRGFEMTDGAYALIASASPADFPATVSRFGHYTGLLYELAGGGIRGLRFGGLLCLLAAATLFAVSLERALGDAASLGSDVWGRLARISAILLATLTFYARWAPTPGYNWLTLIGLLLAHAGLLLAIASVGSAAELKSRRLPPGSIGALVLALGASLTFLAKPSSAALLAPLALLWVALTPLRGAALRFSASAAAATALFLAGHALVFEGGVAAWLSDLSRGLALLQEMGKSYSADVALRRLPSDYRVVVDRAVSMVGPAWWGPIGVGLAVAWLRPRSRSWLDAAALLALLPIWVALWRRGMWDGGARAAPRLVPGGLALASGALLTVGGLAAGTAWTRRADGPRKAGALPLRVGLLLLCAPVVYSFGSATVPLRQAWGGFAFHAAAALAALRWLEPARGGAPLALCGLLAAGAASAIAGAAERPYRLAAPLAEQVHPVRIGERERSIDVDEKTRRYVEALQGMARAGGWTIGTPLIELSGDAPGAVYVLGARAPGTPWLLRSDGEPETRFAKAALQLAAPDTLHRAWVLTTPVGRQSLSPELLVEVGLPFPEGYTHLGRVRRPDRRETQVLWRPRASASAGAGPSIRVMTFNVQKKHWKPRRVAVARTIRRAGPEILSVQEARAPQLDWLLEEFPHYRAIGRFTRAGREGAFSGLLIDRRRFDLLDQESRWLSEEPERPGSVGWDAALPRVFAWARVRDRVTGSVLHVYGTHFDHEGTLARTQSARAIARHLQRVGSGAATPTLLLGDLNVEENSPALDPLFAVGLRDVLREVWRSEEPAVTLVPSRRAEPARRVDYVLCSGDWRVEEVRILQPGPGERPPSDHRPVLAVLSLEAPDRPD